MDFKLVHKVDFDAKTFYYYIEPRCEKVIALNELEYRCITELEEVESYKNPKLDDKDVFEKELEKCIERKIKVLGTYQETLHRITIDDDEIEIRLEPARFRKGVCIIKMIVIMINSKNLTANEADRKAERLLNIVKKILDSEYM